MPRGFTDSVKKAQDTFEILKKESLIKGKNVASINNIAKKSGTSRNNFYTKKSEAWKKLVSDIDNFAKEFQKLAQGKYKNPEVESHKKAAKDCKGKYIAMTQQNYELLEKINDLERIISDKDQTIYLLKKRLNNSTILEEES